MTAGTAHDDEIFFAGVQILDGVSDTLPTACAATAEAAYLGIVAAQSAQETVLRGFTSIRDVGGPSFGLKRAIDEGLVQTAPAAMIWPFGAMISQSSDHGGFACLSQKRWE